MSHPALGFRDADRSYAGALRGQRFRTKPHAADLYTGSGCLLLAALSELPAPASGVGYDISSNAVSIAQRNARRHHLDARAVFVEQDLSGPAPITSAASGKSCWDIVFANPPYIKSDDIPDLMPDVRDFEPSLALDGGPDGLDPYRDMASAVRDGRLRSQWLFLEVGHDQKRRHSRHL